MPTSAEKFAQAQAEHSKQLISQFERRKQRILAFLETTTRLVTNWDVLNPLAIAVMPSPRQALRDERRRYMFALHALIHEGKVCRVLRRFLCLCAKLPQFSDVISAIRRDAKRNRHGQRRSAQPRDPLPRGSTNLPSQPLSDPNEAQAYLDQSVAYWTAASEARKSTEKSESAKSPEEGHNAAQALARLPRKQKQCWTGWLNGRRLRRFTRVRVPSGEEGEAQIVLRGKVYVRFPDKFDRTLNEYLRIYPASAVEVAKNPSAVALGKLKAGIREKPSELKASSARANGCKPCHPGKHRGRPVKTTNKSR